MFPLGKWNCFNLKYKLIKKNQIANWRKTLFNRSTNHQPIAHEYANLFKKGIKSFLTPLITIPTIPVPFLPSPVGPPYVPSMESLMTYL